MEEIKKALEKWKLGLFLYKLLQGEDSIHPLVGTNLLMQWTSVGFLKCQFLLSLIKKKAPLV